MAAVVTHDLITYVDSGSLDWEEVRPGARQKVLFHDPDTGQKTSLVQVAAGYQAEPAPPHQWGEYLYILQGTFVDHNQASGPGTYIHNRPGSVHQPMSPDGCTFLVFVPGRPATQG